MLLRYYIQLLAAGFSTLLFVAPISANHIIENELPERVAKDDTCPILLAPHPPRNISQREIFSQRYSNTRIVGGHLTDDVLESYFLDLENSEEETFCTGILVAPNIALVRAACEFPVPGSYAYYKAKIDGTPTKRKYAVTEFRKHPDYVRQDRGSPNIAYATLNETVDGENGQYALININSMEPRERSVVRMVGYGYNESNAKQKTYRPGFPLVQVDVPVASWQVCNDSYIDGISQKHFCAGYMEGGCSGCSGDGPVIQYNDAGVPVLVGLVYDGPITCGSKNAPDIVTRIGSIPNLLEFLPESVTTTENLFQVIVSPTPTQTPNSNLSSVSEPIDDKSFPISYIIAIVAGIGAAIVVLTVATLLCCVF